MTKIIHAELISVCRVIKVLKKKQWCIFRVYRKAEKTCCSIKNTSQSFSSMQMQIREIATVGKFLWCKEVKHFCDMLFLKNHWLCDSKGRTKLKISTDRACKEGVTFLFANKCVQLSSVSTTAVFLDNIWLMWAKSLCGLFHFSSELISSHWGRFMSPWILRLLPSKLIITPLEFMARLHTEVSARTLSFITSAEPWR